MDWHDIRDPNDPELDRLAERYKLHPLHIEDCRHRNQIAKVEPQDNYLFVVLKPVQLDEEHELDISDLDLFVAADFVITVQETEWTSIDELIGHVRQRAGRLRPDQVMHRILDGVVDSYSPLLDRLSHRIDELQDEVLASPEPGVLEKVLGMKRALLGMRRVNANTRDVANHLMRLEGDLIHADLQPFLRDVYDHVSRNLDLIETQRELLASAVDIYLSGISNRMSGVMKALTVVSTLSLPAIVIAGIYGMNLRRLPFADHPHAWGIVTGLIGACCVLLLVLLRLLRLI
ncbi:MAG TPA: magnesium transporter CorA family protein [Bryobacteraceae bacterium]|nr:magnesium transporter CorA family protein [Bryobacteraceae bacterium]